MFVSILSMQNFQVAQMVGFISQGSFIQTKPLFVLIHIRIKGENGTVKLV